MSPSALFVTTVPITLEAFLVPFAEHFRALGWRIDALANGASTHAPIDGAFDARFDIAWSRNPLSPGNLLGAAAKVRRIVAEGDYDIVHVHTPIAAFVTRWALRRRPRGSRPVVVYTAHGFHFYEGGHPASNAAFRTLERTAGAWTDYLVTINREDFAAARALGTVIPERVRLIEGIGVDLERYAPGSVTPAEIAQVRAGLGVADATCVATMIAELAPVKRHRHVFEALALVEDPGVRLVLVGTGPLESALRERAVALGVGDRIVWAGYRRDIPAVLAASDVVVLASEREGLPRSVLEAMAAGKPVIGTATRGIADAVGPDAGWIVDKHDPHALARAIGEAARDPEERDRRGRAARARAETTFGLEHVIGEYERLYGEALATL